MSMKDLYITGDAPGFPRPEPAEVYQEAAHSLRYKRITAITAVKLQRAMALLQLEPHVLVQQGLASRSSLERSLEYGEGQGEQLSSVAAKRSNSPRVVSSCLQNDLNGMDDEDDQDDQDDGWGTYEDNYDSDSDIDDDDDQDDEIEGRRKGPIYAFLVYGGVQLRPDEYVLLFRALGVSPEYVEQLNHSNIETDHNHDKAPPPSPRANHRANATHPRCEMIGSKPSPPHGPSSNGRDGLGGTGRHEYSCRCLSLRYIYPPSSVYSLQIFRDILQQTLPALNSVSTA